MNLPINTIVFTANLMSGGLKQRKINYKGGVIEKRLRTTVSDSFLYYYP